MIGAEVVCRGNPQAVFKFPGLAGIVHKGTPGGCKKTVHFRFVDDGGFMITLALDCPISAPRRMRDDINACVLPAERGAVWEIIPKPDGFEDTGVERLRKAADNKCSISPRN